MELRPRIASAPQPQIGSAQALRRRSRHHARARGAAVAPRTARSSRCPTRARPSGTSRTRPGSSRPSCSRRTVAGYEPFNPAFKVLFNSYYNGVGDKHPRPERGLLSRPSLDEVLAYRDHVDARDARRSSRRAGSTPRSPRSSSLGLHHEQQHQELILTDLKHMLSRNPAAARLPEAMAAHAGASRASRSWIGVAGGPARDRPRRRGLRLRQRDAAPPRLARRLRDRLAPGDARRLHRTSSRTAATAGPSCGSPLGWDAVADARLGSAAVLGEARRRSGTRSRCAAWRRSSPTRRCAT